MPHFIWTDRRPIATLELTISSQPTPTNPYAFFRTNLDATNPHAFEEAAIQYALLSVANMEATHCQGFLLWDLPGKFLNSGHPEYQNPFPLPPCWTDALVDRFFQILGNEGHILPGVLVRPALPTSNLFTHEFLGMVPIRSHRDTDQAWDWSAEHLVVRRAQAAYNRWGCRLFYIDSPSTNLDYEAIRQALTFDPLFIPERTPGLLPSQLSKYESGIPWHKWLHGDAQAVNPQYAGFTNFDKGYAASGEYSDFAVKQRFTAAASAGTIVSFYGWYLSRGQKLYREWLQELKVPVQA